MNSGPISHSATSEERGQGGKIGVLLVDDSVVIRGALSKIIESDPAIEIVGSVSNGEMGVISARKHQPHIVILDIEMPVMDGLTALPKILEASPDSKVIMFSALTEEGATHTLKAFSLGAVECFVKPSSSEDTGEGSEFQTMILKTIKGLAPKAIQLQPQEQGIESVAQPTALPEQASKPFELYQDNLSFKGKPDILLIGSSTGGPQALLEVINSFQDFDIPIVITQHMPKTFTKLLAENIQQATNIPSHEGADGMALENGHIYVAPGGYHMIFEQEGGQTVIKLDDGPPVNFCKPAVDPMFDSAYAIYGNKMLAAILTGMGNDGLHAGKRLVENGVRLIAQDEATSVVWGMPGAVAQAGICSAVLPLKEIGPWIRRTVTG